jgi:hypothetical protein
VPARLALRCIDVVLPTFLVPYLLGIWFYWGDGLVVEGACSEPELTALGRWLCLGWLPCLAAAPSVGARREDDSPPCRRR